GLTVCQAGRCLVRVSLGPSRFPNMPSGPSRRGSIITAGPALCITRLKLTSLTFRPSCADKRTDDIAAPAANQRGAALSRHTRRPLPKSLFSCDFQLKTALSPNPAGGAGSYSGGSTHLVWGKVRTGVRPEKGNSR